MKKKLLTTLATLSLTTILSLSSSLTVLATEAGSGNTPKSVPTKSAESPLDRMPYGINVETLWLAEAGEYDIRETGLEKHEFAELAPGKTYEVAIQITNNSDRNIATPYGFDWEISVPRVVETGKLSQIEVTARSDIRNTDNLWDYTWVPSAKIMTSESVALIYKDQSNYVYYLENGKLDNGSSNGAGFSWQAGSRILEESNITLDATDQGLYAGTSRIVTFQFETVKLSEWQDLANAMRTEPVKVKLDDVCQSLVGREVHAYATLSLPKWLRDQMRDKDSSWRILTRPVIDEDGRVSVCARIENHGAAYAVVTSNVVTLRSGSVTLKELTDATFNDEYKGYAKSYALYDGPDSVTWVACGMSDYDFRKDEVIKIDMTVSTR